MPYRRLPNTDAARLKAMKDAIGKSMKTSPYQLAFSHNMLQRVKSYSPLFEQAMQRHRQAYQTQVQRSRGYSELSRKARLYLSHFLQVMNFMILRGELPESTRRYYGLTTDSKVLPNLSTDVDLLKWGQQVIDGDMERQKTGGKLIANPTAAVVRVHFEKFVYAFHQQKVLRKITVQNLKKITSMRDQADEIILAIWNEVEASFVELPDDEKREQAMEYGLKYVYRPHEKKQKMTIAEERAMKFSMAGEKSKTVSSEEEIQEDEGSLHQLSLFSDN